MPLIFVGPRHVKYGLLILTNTRARAVPSAMFKALKHGVVLIKNRGSSLQKYQSFSSIGDVSDANGYKLPPKYRKMRINFVKIEILEVKTGVQVSKNINHFHIALADVSDANGYKLPPKYRKMRINFVKIEILEVKTGVQGSQKYQSFSYSIGDASNANGYKLPLPPMQMGINYALNIGKI